MSRSFNRLQRVLDLEAKQGYKNTAVVGGIRQFATFWVGQARDEAGDELDAALVEQIADVLAGYDRLPGPEARAKAIADLTAQLQRREERVGKTEDKGQKPKDEKRPKAEARTPKTDHASRITHHASPITDNRLPITEPEEPPPPIEPEEAPPPKRAFKQVEPDPEGLSQPVSALKGVGPKIAEQLGKLGAATIWELLYTFPRRYDDYTLMKPINRLQYGEQVTVIGTIWETRARRTGNRVIVQSTISDGTGNIQATWFNQPWLTESLKAGTQIVLSGTVDQFLGRLVFTSPDWELLELDPLKTRRIVPVYPLTKGLNGNKMREIMRTAVDHWSPRVPDPLPNGVRQRQNLDLLPVALAQTHFPDSQQELHNGRRRLIFDELFLLQLGMAGSRREWQSQPGIRIETDESVLTPFQEALPFALTGAQQRVIGEIIADMAAGVPMNRLLQGDVGAGKTVVAAAAMLTAVRANHQTALMAPTEILAEQHYQGLSRLLTPLGITTGLLTGSTPATAREQILAGLADGSIHVAIGTHALIQEQVQFHSLALAVIDEQHRFGVDQRQALRDKGSNQGEKYNPHLLSMSATPIPRTLALSLYGDLDVSILDEMPPGRQEIKTRWLPGRDRERAYAFIRKEVKAGRQAFVIYPLVEESDKLDAPAAVDDHKRLDEQVFPDLRVGLVHGRLPSADKEAVMRAFKEGELDILVSTSVIEVGVDVPNATVMLIEGANRFGLAQLHQFRGRVGRGEYQSYCLLISDSEANGAGDRLAALEQSNDGFVLAEKDLELRGPGEFFGRRQSGLPELKLASLLDMEMLQKAQQEARAIFADDPQLEKPEHALLKERIARFWEDATDIS
ncbi:MAG: ATP-dependent DNA helicase RecG [Anaerolineae bacterium]|nr:ATP-dependent DNA helicase RecG [Anaerolineae bacterium]